MKAVTSPDVAAYSGLVNSLARKYAGYSGAEFDDLCQEGLIAVFLTLRVEKDVAAKFLEWRMMDWCRFLRRLTNNDGLAYEVLLPFEWHDASEV